VPAIANSRRDRSACTKAASRIEHCLRTSQRRPELTIQQNATSRRRLWWFFSHNRFGLHRNTTNVYVRHGLHRPAIRARKMTRTQCAIIRPTTAPPCVMEERAADFWRMRVRALVSLLSALTRGSTLPSLHQSSPRCRSLRCVPVNAGSYRCINAVQMPMAAGTVIGLNRCF